MEKTGIEESKELENLKKIKKEYEAGCLSIFRNLTEEECDLYFQQVSDSVGYKLDILRKTLEDDVLLLRIMDIFAGESVGFPNRKQTYQFLDRAMIYAYVSKRGFTEEACRGASRKYNEKLAQVKMRVTKLRELLESREYESLEKAQRRVDDKEKPCNEER